MFVCDKSTWSALIGSFDIKIFFNEHLDEQFLKSKIYDEKIEWKSGFLKNWKWWTFPTNCWVFSAFEIIFYQEWEFLENPSLFKYMRVFIIYLMLKKAENIVNNKKY